jgi:hypothetical protein
MEMLQAFNSLYMEKPQGQVEYSVKRVMISNREAKKLQEFQTLQLLNVCLRFVPRERTTFVQIEHP